VSVSFSLFGVSFSLAHACVDTAFVASRPGWLYCDDSRVTSIESKEVVVRTCFLPLQTHLSPFHRDAPHMYYTTNESRRRTCHSARRSLTLLTARGYLNFSLFACKGFFLCSHTVLSLPSDACIVLHLIFSFTLSFSHLSFGCFPNRTSLQVNVPM
jgi:hypothetical protein